MREQFSDKTASDEKDIDNEIFKNFFRLYNPTLLGKELKLQIKKFWVSLMIHLVFKRDVYRNDIPKN